MNKILGIFSNLSGSVKIALGILGMMTTAFGAVFIYSAARADRVDPEWALKNEVDRDILPPAYEERKPEQKIEKVVVIAQAETAKPKETFKVKRKKPVAKPAVPEIKDNTASSQAKVEIPKAPPTQVEEEAIRDLEAEAIAAFNARALQFSTLDHGRLKAEKFSNSDLSKKYRRKIDRNKQKRWKIKTDENTYPTDLTRVVNKEKIIKCITRNKIVSTLPGKVTIFVSENVYGAQGNNILIPRGAEGTGIYNPVEKIGNDRINLFVERFVNKEDGQLIIFSNPAIAGDQQGATGVTGEIDRKYLEKIGMPLIFSFANNLANLGFSKIIEGLEGDVEEGEESIAKELFDAEWERNQATTNSQVVNEFIKQNFKITETITIPAATEITVYLNHDIWFKPNLNGNVVTAVKLEPDWRSNIKKPSEQGSPEKPSGP